MDVLCFDIGTGGVAAARFTENLEAAFIGEIPWQVRRDAHGNSVLPASELESAFKHLAQSLQGSAPVAALAITCFMHSFVITDGSGHPRSPVYTWMDTTGSEGIRRVRQRFGSEFHPRTGCRYYPMFPVFKLASMQLNPDDCILSPKAFLVRGLTEECVEDYGAASASGLLNARTAAWDSEILETVGVQLKNLPRLAAPHECIGKVTQAASERLGIRIGTRVVNGSGDGFLANVGSGCESSTRIAMTLGTSSSARQTLATPVFEESAGTFCYRASDEERFLLGCAGSNGGNALDWARRTFGPALTHIAPDSDIPIFFPWLNGERSFEWDPLVRASWHGLNAGHGPAELIRSVMEGVVFNMAQYAERIQSLSRIQARQAVLSGNGFREPALAPLLAALFNGETLLPREAGLASLRGAAMTAWRALGHDAGPAMERFLAVATPVAPMRDPGLLLRYEEFKTRRSAKPKE